MSSVRPPVEALMQMGWLVPQAMAGPSRLAIRWTKKSLVDCLQTILLRTASLLHHHLTQPVKHARGQAARVAILPTMGRFPAAPTDRMDYAAAVEVAAAPSHCHCARR